MTDRELLELAAKAAGYRLHVWGTKGAESFACMDLPNTPRWNPIDDDGDALRLAVKLRLEMQWWKNGVGVESPSHGNIGIQSFDDDPYSATRRAIVRAAAAIGASL